MVQEGVVDDSEHGSAVVDEADGDACKGEAVDKVGRSVCASRSDWVVSRWTAGSPIGSTQNVGSSVSEGVFPAEKDSSPMLSYVVGHSPSAALIEQQYYY